VYEATDHEFSIYMLPPVQFFIDTDDKMEIIQ